MTPTPVTAADRLPAPAAVAVDVVVLSCDLDLFDAARDAAGEHNPVWRARTVAESADLLLTGRCGVLLIDLVAVSAQPASLIHQVVDQFPDVVVVVAGRREDEPRLGPLLSDGLVYRFMHKPLSPKRAGMFLGAAMRNHLERRNGRERLRLLPQVGRLRRRLRPGKRLYVGAGAALLLPVLGVLLLSGRGADDGAAPAPAVARSPPPAPSPAPAPAAERSPVPSRPTAPDPGPTLSTQRPAAPRARPSPARAAAIPASPPPASAVPTGHGGTASGRDTVPASRPRPAAGSVQPDPLTPRYVARAVPVSPSRPGGNRSRSYGAPIASGHAIAGLAAPGSDDPSADAPQAWPGVVSRDLAALATPPPGYPAQALRDRVAGWVDVEYTVNEHGDTTDIVVSGSEPTGVFDAAATSAVAGWRYLPRVVNGRAVAQRTSVTLRFSVER
jgi:protein TonB